MKNWERQGKVAPVGLGNGMLDWSGKVRLVLFAIRRNQILKYCQYVKIFSQGPLKYASKLGHYSNSNEKIRKIRYLISNTNSNTFEYCLKIRIRNSNSNFKFNFKFEIIRKLNIQYRVARSKKL